MLKQCLAVVALSAAQVGYSLTLCAAPAASSSRSMAPSKLSAHLLASPVPPSRVTMPRLAAPQPLAPVTQPQPPVSRTVDPERPIHEQMRVLDSVAKKDMLLYTGHFAPVHHASIQHLPHVMALSLPRLGAPD